MSARKRPKNDPLIRNKGLNRSLRVKGRKRRVHDQVHVGLQDRLEREIKIRDGASRLLKACTHESQLLEAAKTLQTSNARTFAYMAELQKLKAQEVMDALMDDPMFSEDSKICKGRIAVSDIRIPLIWREVFANNKTKDPGKHAAFCLLSIGSEVQDTELVCIDKTTTDISFYDVVVFEDAPYDFKLKLEVYAYPMSGTAVTAPTPQKLLSRLNRSIGRGEGKRTREKMKETSSAIGPQYIKIGTLTLTLNEISESMRSHDIERLPTSETHLSLPLYESITCRLVAQPKCITEKCVTGFLHTLEMIGSIPSWSYVWCELQAGLLKCWTNPEDSATKQPKLFIDVLPKDIKINEIEKSRQKRANSFQVRDMTERNIFAANEKDDVVRWIRGLRQHKIDHSAWGTCSLNEFVDDCRKPMYIASPSPHKLPSQLIFDRGVRKTLVYDQLSMESPIKAMSEAIKCTDLLKSNDVKPEELMTSVQSMLLENQTAAPWANFFTGISTKPSKVTRVTDIQSNSASSTSNHHHGYNLRDSTSKQSPRRKMVNSSSEGSDDAFLSESEERVPKDKDVVVSPSGGSAKKKRRAPMPPKAKNTPPPKPKLPPKLIKKNVSAQHSFDDAAVNSSSSRIQKKKSSFRGEADGKEIALSNDSISCPSSLSSGYKSESEVTIMSVDSNPPKERLWAKRENCVMPVDVIPLSRGDYTTPTRPQRFERSQSLDVDGFNLARNPGKYAESQSMLSPMRDDVIYAEADEYCRKNASLPSVSPSRAARCSPVPSSEWLNSKPVPSPRRSYLTAVESNKVNENSKLACRPLAYDVNNKVYRQSRPPALPPKTLRKAKSQDSATTVEPVYATVDKTKKGESRSLKKKGVATYTTAHKAIIEVCKQRMQEEQQKADVENNYQVIQRDVTSRV